MTEGRSKGLRARLEAQGLKPGQHPARHVGLLIATTDTIVGTEIDQTLGLVMESHIIDFGLDVSIADATVKRLAESARTLGADAVTGFRVATSQGLFVAYGTGVTLRNDSQVRE